MDAIKQLMLQLDDPSRILEVRRTIAILILGHLKSLDGTPRHWAKVHTANAIAALAMNIHSVGKPTNTWLRLCLVDLQKAFDAAHPDAPYTLRERYLDTVTIEEMTATLEALGDWT